MNVEMLSQNEYSSGSEFSLNLSCESSEYEEDSELVVSAQGVKPYQFEPYCSMSEEIRDDSDFEEDVISHQTERLGNTDWCNCGVCVETERSEESICCREISQILLHMDTLQAQEGVSLTCITEHPGFEATCLNRFNLYTVYMAYNQQYGVSIGNSPERHRYTAYRQFVRWMWGYLGKEIRVVLPSCAVNKIRSTYPCPQGSYVGFQAPH